MNTKGLDTLVGRLRMLGCIFMFIYIFIFLLFLFYFFFVIVSLEIKGVEDRGSISFFGGTVYFSPGTRAGSDHD